MSNFGRSTVQRQIILDTLNSTNTHPSVDELYSEIKKKHPSISKATVYRNMRQLADIGKILQIAVENDVSRYDGNTEAHQHFICDSCGGIFDVNIDFAEGSKKLKSVVENMNKHSVDRCVVSFYGTCSNCVKP